MPQYVKVNKDFYFTLRDELDPDYRPDIELTVTNNEITDSHDNRDYQHGNLTISGRSKLAVNDFSMVLAPYAKYAYEGEVITTITIIDTSAPPASLSRAKCVPKTSPSTFGTPPTAGSSCHSPSMSR